MTADHQSLQRGNFIKITILLDKADWHEHAKETMWAEPSEGGGFRLRNVPFYAYGMSYDDTVVANQSADGWVFQYVAERGGHSTYRIFVSNTGSLVRFPHFWTRLERKGCTLERATERLFAVDVPPVVDVREAYEVLASGEAAGVWDFEEAHVGHSLKADQQ